MHYILGVEIASVKKKEHLTLKRCRRNVHECSGSIHGDNSLELLRWKHLLQFEQIQKQRQEERELREKEKMKEKEGECRAGGTQLRREIWVHPEGGKRVHRTTSAAQNTDDSETELQALPHLTVSILS